MSQLLLLDVASIWNDVGDVTIPLGIIHAVRDTDR
jgi:hypothetical protein